MKKGFFHPSLSFLLILGPIIALLLMATMGIISIHSLEHTNKLSNRDRDTLIWAIEAMNQARDAQVHLKKQVQEWKNILLRGEDREQYEKYFKSFQYEEQEVQNHLRHLRDTLSHLPFGTKLDVSTQETIQLHQQLGEHYQQALKNYISGIENESHHAVDNLVKGIDRKPTTEMDNLVEKLMEGVLLLTAEISSRNEKNYEDNKWRLAITIGLTGLGIALMSWLLRRWMMRQVEHIALGLTEMAQGKLTYRFQMPPNPNEMDRLADHMNSVFAQLGHSITTNKLQVATLQASTSEIAEINAVLSHDAESANLLNQEISDGYKVLRESFITIRELALGAMEAIAMVNQLATRLSDELHAIAQAVHRGGNNTQAIASSADQMTLNLTQVILAQDQVSESVRSVAEALGHMQSSLDSVRLRCISANKRSEQAHHNAREMLQMMEKLSDSAHQIDGVVELINNIAEQTNMLALNAAIEAAGAGNAGKGFAVVANEVKELARQTSQATQLIVHQVEEIQTGSLTMKRATETISTIIGDICQANEDIVVAVDDQSITLKHIAQSMAGVAQSAEEVSRHSEEIRFGAQEVAAAVANAATDMAEIIQSTNKIAQGGEEMVRSSDDSRQRNLQIVAATEQTNAISTTCSDNMRQLENLTHFTHKSVGHLDLLTKAIVHSSQELTAVAAGLDTGNPPFDIVTLKKLYLSLVGQLEKVASGRISFFDEEEVAEELSKIEANLNGAGLPTRADIQKLDQKIRGIAKEVFGISAAGEDKDTNPLLKDLNNTRSQLFALLDQVYLASTGKQIGIVAE